MPIDRLLSLALRPKQLSLLVGQETLVTALRQQMTRRAPRALLFHGASGSGKTTIARIIALALQCDHQRQWGDPCGMCWERWLDFSIHEINASEVSGIDEIREVARLGRCMPAEGSKSRVVILDEAQLITTHAQNLLLKHFEEAAATTTWIICTTVPNKILVTLRRRCMIYAVTALSPSACDTLLKSAFAKAQLKLPVTPLLKAALAAQVTSPGWLLMAVEKYQAGYSAEQAIASTDAGSIDPLPICRAIAKGDCAALKRCLADVGAEDARWVRASVAGYLRGMLRREASSVRSVVLAEALIRLGAPGVTPLEEGMMLNWLWGTLVRICLGWRKVLGGTRPIGGG